MLDYCSPHLPPNPLMEDTLKVYLNMQKRKKQQTPNGGRSSAATATTEQPPFAKGSKVEVSSDDEGFRGAWYIGTIIDIDDKPPPAPSPSPSPSPSSSNKKKRKQTPKREASQTTRYLVEYETLLADDEEAGDGTPKGPLTEYVDVAFMRPLPPSSSTDDGQQQQPFEVNDVVDAYHRDGWWTGVVTGVLDGGSKYEVVFQDPPDQIQCAGSELRVHHDWVNGKWVRAEKKEIIEPEGGLSNQSRKRGRPQKALVEDHQEIIKPEGEVSYQNRTRGRLPKLPVERPKRLVKGEEKNGAEAASYELVVKECATNEAEQSTIGGFCFQGKMSFSNGCRSRLPQNITSNLMDLRRAKFDDKFSETIAEKSGRKLRNCPSSRRSQRSMTNDKTPTQDKCREKPSEEIEDQRPQLMWYEGMNSPSTVDDSNISVDKNVIEGAEASDRQDENAIQPLAIASTYNGASQKNSNSPFEKHSPIWKTLERMEIFQKIPQQPHFSPLDKYKEDSREGLAIGNMVIFANVVERTSKLQLSDPRSLIDSSLETLCDLETHGFYVDPIRRRLNELLSKKERQEQLLEESKGVEIEIAEKSLERGKIGEEIRQLKKKVKELQEKLMSTTSTAKIKDYGIAALRSKMQSMQQQIQDARKDFERLAAAPW